VKVILVGRGKIVYFLARQFTKKRIEVLIVTPDAEEAGALARRLSVPVLEGDGTDPKVLQEAGAYRADAVLALMANDEDNLAVCQIAGRLYQVPRTIALVNDPENEEIFQRLDVSVAISATRVLSTLLGEHAGFEEVAKIVSLAEGNVSVSEFILRESAPAAGKTVKTVELPAEALIGGIVRDGKVLIPKGGTKLLAGDRLVVIATQESLDDALRCLAGDLKT